MRESKIYNISEVCCQQMAFQTHCEKIYGFHVVYQKRGKKITMFPGPNRRK